MNVKDPATACRPEKRKFKRIRLYIPGTLFNPINDEALDCRVLDLSAGGAAVQCDGNFAQGARFLLHVTGFGRFDGNAVFHEHGVLRLDFSIRESNRGRLEEMLALFVAGGLAAVTRSLKHEREPSIGSGVIIREDGQHLKCDFLDVSLEGVSLRAMTRPQSER